MAPLTDLQPGSRGRLTSLGGDRSFQRRLMELGFLPGTPVSVVRRIPMGGVLELELRQSRVTLRLSEARDVRVAID